LDRAILKETLEANIYFAWALLAVCDAIAPPQDLKFADPKFAMHSAACWLGSTFITAHVFRYEAEARLCKIIRRHYPTLPRMPKLTRR